MGLWVIAAVCVVVAIFGAANFQELYGGASGAQFFLFAFILALVPSAIGWWAYRRTRGLRSWLAMIEALLFDRVPVESSRLRNRSDGLGEPLAFSAQ